MGQNKYIEINQAKVLNGKKRKDLIAVALVVIFEAFLFIFACIVEVHGRYAFSDYLSNRVKEGTSGFWNSMLLLKENISANMDSLCELVVTFSTITTAIVVLGHTVIDNKRFGIPNRTIVHYFAGSYTIIAVFVISLLKIPMLQLLLYMEQKGFLLTELVAVLLQQVIVVIFTMSSGTLSFAMRIIARQELKLYKRQKKLLPASQDYISADKIPHVRHAMESEELFSDKAELLRTILLEPIKKYDKKTVRKANKQNYGVAFWKKEFSNLYDFYYDNALGAFRALLSKEEDRHKLYDFFYGFMDRYISLTGSERTTKEYQKMLTIMFAAVMNAALVSGVAEAEEFCTYILCKIICKDSEMVREQRIQYFFMLELLYHIDASKLHMNYIRKVLEIQPWSWNSADSGNYWFYWEIIASKYTIDRKNAVLYFNQAVQTLKGEEKSSVPMMYILQQMKE